jgi:hypothetical protein
MKIWIGAGVVTVAVAASLAFGGPIATASEAAAFSKRTMQMADARRSTDFNGRRYHRSDDRQDYRTYARPQPRYYARPYYYRPYPYAVPAPFTFGFAFSPGW